jgi:hypothetical protein
VEVAHLDAVGPRGQATLDVQPKRLERKKNIYIIIIYTSVFDILNFKYNMVFLNSSNPQEHIGATQLYDNDC